MGSLLKLELRIICTAEDGEYKNTTLVTMILHHQTVVFISLPFRKRDLLVLYFAILIHCVTKKEK